LAKAKTSRPDSSATKAGSAVPFDKLYWIRIGFGAIAGILADWVSGLDASNALWNGITVGLGFYLASYYLARYGVYRKSDGGNFSKFYTTGIGGFIMVFLFTWILLFTLNAFYNS
jgi:uncharacterized membrane protein YeaQ/YmgE (transglycosylase-associated protein family)